MKSRHISAISTIVGMAIWLYSASVAADEFHKQFQEMDAQWWQWATSIPVTESPLLDPSGAKCSVGQRGPVWFLAGAFGGGTVTRSCSVPEGKSLFFPLINLIGWNSPSVCGQDANNLTGAQIRASIDPIIDQATKLSVNIDGTQLHNIFRVNSRSFEITLPTGSIFDQLCMSAGLGSVPADLFARR